MNHCWILLFLYQAQQIVMLYKLGWEVVKNKGSSPGQQNFPN